MAFKMKGNPYKMGKMATKSTMKMAKEAMKMKKEAMAKMKKESPMDMKTSYKMKEAMAKMKSPMELKKDSPMDKYKSDAQRKAVHASKAERGMTMKKKSPVPQDKSKQQAALDKQAIQIRKDMESGKLSPSQAGVKLMAIQKKMKELGTLPNKMKKEEAMKMKKEAPMKAAKPDYIDLDGDGNKTESMKKAAADKKSGAKMKKKEPMTMKKEAMKMKKGEAMKMKKEAMKMKKDPAMKAKFDDNPKDFVKVPSTGEMVKPNNPKNITEIIKIIKKGEQTPGTRNQIKKLENKRRKLADKEGPAKKA